MELTRSNYHSKEANLAYMSVSQYKSWLDCPARTLAELKDEYIEQPSDALILGSYVDQALLSPDELAEEMAGNPDKYTTKSGKPRAFVETGNVMAERAKRDVIFMSALKGEHQVIFTFRLAGLAWKAMLDVVDPGANKICDLKTTRSIDELYWSEAHSAKVPFYEVHNYWLQLAVYRQAYKASFGSLPKLVLIAAISKEDPPDIAVVLFKDTRRFNYEIEAVKSNADKIAAWKDGSEPARRCERCGYCRETKKLSEISTATSHAVITITPEEFAYA